MGLDLPHVPKADEKLTAKWGAKVARALRAMQLGRSESIGATITPTCTILEVRRRNGGSGVNYEYPFKLSVETDPADEDKWLASLGPGFVNQVEATIEGVPLHEGPTLSITKGVLTRIYVEIKPFADWQPDTVELKTGPSTPWPGHTIDWATPTNSRLRVEVARVLADGRPLNTVMNNLNYAMANTGPSFAGV